MIVYAYSFICDSCGVMDPGEAWELPQSAMESPRPPKLPNGWFFISGHQLWCHNCVNASEVN